MLPAAVSASGTGSNRLTPGSSCAPPGHGKESDSRSRRSGTPIDALRRAELAHLQVRDIEQRAGRWVLPDLVGKGGRVRTVPLPAWVKLLLNQWIAEAEIDSGPLFRSINKGGAVSPNGFSENAVWGIVKQYAGDLDLGNLAPHDLRRTCARLCRESGGALEQIQLLLGHASIQTTMNYLGTQQNLTEAVNDRLGLAV